MHIKLGAKRPGTWTKASHVGCDCRWKSQSLYFYASTHSRDQRHYAFGLSVHPLPVSFSIHMNLVSAITPECRLNGSTYYDMTIAFKYIRLELLLIKNTYWDSFKHFWKFEVQLLKPGSPHDQILAKLQFQIHKYIHDVPGGNFCQWERFTGAVLSISENLRFRGQMWA